MKLAMLKSISKLIICNFTISYLNVPPILEVHVDGKGQLTSYNRATIRFARVGDIYQKHTRVTWIDMQRGTKNILKNTPLETSLVPTQVSGNDTIDNTVTVPISEATIKPLSLPPESDEIDSDIFECFKTLPTIFWVLIGIQLFLFCLLYIVLNYKRYSSRLKLLLNIIWSIYGGIFNSKYQFDLVNNPQSIVGLLSIFILFVVAYFGATFNTDLVIVKKPFIIDHIRDIVDPRGDKYSIAIRRSSRLFDAFEKSPSIVRRKVAVKCRQAGLENCLVQDDFSVAMVRFLNYDLKPSVVIAEDIYVRILVSILCGERFETKTGKAMLPHIGRDSSGNELLFYRINSPNDTCRPLKEKLIKANAYAASEFGLSQEFIKAVHLYQFRSGSSPWQCLFKEDFFPENKYTSLKSYKLIKLFIIFGGAIVVSLIVLIIECIVKKCKQASVACAFKSSANSHHDEC